MTRIDIANNRQPGRLRSSLCSLLVSICVSSYFAAYWTNKAGVSLERTKINDQLSFGSPHHLQLLRHNNDTSSASLGVGAATSNLSGTTEPPQNPAQNSSNISNKRPSGVVYQYIEPPPINLTARAQLIAGHKFRLGLSDLSKNNQTNTTTTALCGIVKDAENYLDEWVDYHFGLGFHTIYIVDNSETHELKSWQDKRRNAGYSVRVLPKPGTHRQMYSYHMCAAEFKNDHTFMAFFDVDEFLVLKKHDKVDDMLVDHLSEGSLAISWFIFGSGNTSMYAPQPVTKRFLYRDGETPETRHGNQWANVKSILKLEDYGNYPQSPHSMKTRRGGWKDTSGGGSFDKIGATNKDRPTDVAVLHHYKYLSPKEFHWKSCVRKTVDDKFKECDGDKQESSVSYKGHTFDDTAWKLLKKNVPKYAMFDEFEDFM